MRAASGARIGICPCGRHRASRHQAVELDAGCRRAKSASSIWASRAWKRPTRRRRELTQDRLDPRHRRLHAAGAGPEHAQGRPAGRRLFARLHALFSVDRPAGLRRRDGDGAAGRPSRASRAVAAEGLSRGAGVAGSGVSADGRQAARATAAIDGRSDFGAGTTSGSAPRPRRVDASRCSICLLVDCLRRSAGVVATARCGMRRRRAAPGGWPATMPRIAGVWKQWDGIVLNITQDGEQFSAESTYGQPGVDGPLAGRRHDFAATARSRPSLSTPIRRGPSRRSRRFAPPNCNRTAQRSAVTPPGPTAATISPGDCKGRTLHTEPRTK